jgi:hypothetical protein
MPESIKNKKTGIDRHGKSFNARMNKNKKKLTLVDTTKVLMPESIKNKKKWQMPDTTKI